MDCYTVVWSCRTDERLLQRDSPTPLTNHSITQRQLVYHSHCESLETRVLNHSNLDYPNSTTDNYYETARYRFNSNGSVPQCVTGVVVWTHGRYSFSPNGSLILTPFGDGYQQIQDPCAAESNFVENYNQTEIYSLWQIFQDPLAGNKLHLFQFDGTPLAPQFQVSTSPNMLPTQMLRNVSAPTVVNGGTLRKRGSESSGAERRWTSTSAMGAAMVVFAVGLATLCL